MTTPQPTPPHIVYPSGPPGSGETLQPFPMYPNAHQGPDGIVQDAPPQAPVTPPGSMSRGALDGIHGTGPDEPQRWAPSHAGELPPYWTKDYVQDKTDPNLWWPDHRPSAPGSTHPASYHGDHGDHGNKAGAHDAAAGKLDVNPAELHRASDDYAQLQAAAAALGPQALDEVNRITATHGVMGYPLAVGLVSGLAKRQEQLETKSADFGRYSERFVEHATAYRTGDHEGAGQYQAMGGDASWDWLHDFNDGSDIVHIHPGGAAAGPNAIAIPPGLV